MFCFTAENNAPEELWKWVICELFSNVRRTARSSRWGLLRLASWNLLKMSWARRLFSQTNNVVPKGNDQTVLTSTLLKVVLHESASFFRTALTHNVNAHSSVPGKTVGLNTVNLPLSTRPSQLEDAKKSQSVRRRGKGGRRNGQS